MAGILMDRFRYAPPAAADFGTLYEAGTGANPSLIDTTGRGLVMKFGAGTIANNSDYLKAATKAKASASSQDIIARIQTPHCFNFGLQGLCVSDGTKFVAFGFAPTSSIFPGIKVARWTNDTTFGSDRLTNFPIGLHVEWLRIGIVSGDPSVFYVSTNGTDWIEVFTESQAGFLTYTQVGLCLHVNRNAGSSFPVAGTEQSLMNVFYYSDPDIGPGF
jgi:hypothetical protein